MLEGSHIVAVALDLAAGLLAFYWGAGLGRVLSAIIRVPTARAGVAAARARAPDRPVCVVIPAHNEEASIGPLVRSLRGQTHGRLSVVLCLDRCTDRTREAALAAIDGDPRFTMLEVRDCPEGWAGKVHAAHRGSESGPARGAELLLFLDADTTLEEECIAAAAALMRDRRLDLVSLLSTLSSHRWYELVVQPAAVMELVRQYPIVRANRTTGRRAFANGQFMLFTRAAYDAIGGHAAVREELLEDLALARGIAAAERPAGLFLAEGLLGCRMYENFTAFCAGWKRIYTESTHRKAGRLRKAAVCNIAGGAVLPACALANVVLSLWLVRQAGLSWRLGVVGLCLSGSALVLWLAVQSISYRLGRAPLWALPACAAGAWVVGRILLEALRDLRAGAPTTWGGRTYTRVPR